MAGIRDKINSLFNNSSGGNKEQVSEDELQAWTRMHEAVLLNTALVEFSKVIQNNSQSLKQLCTAVLQALMQRFNCSYGAILLYDKRSECLELIAELGSDHEHPRTLKIQPGDGLTGQTFIDGQTKHLTDLPPGYFTYNIKSGSGARQASNILIVPAKFNNAIAGIIEIAGFSTFNEKNRELIERIAESFAATVISLKAGFENAELLEELRAITEKANTRMQKQYESQQKLLTQVVENSRKREKELLDEIERLKNQ
jgi:transcriptional regulator with GAF, ATPase, and Fis domain